jgi:hypothetical protein
MQKEHCNIERLLELWERNLINDYLKEAENLKNDLTIIGEIRLPKNINCNYLTKVGEGYYCLNKKYLNTKTYI